MPDLDAVLLALERARARATYGAVAGVTGGMARSLMNHRPRNPRHSWVVSQATGRPTGYEPQDEHPELYARDRVIGSADELRALLERDAGHAGEGPV